MRHFIFAILMWMPVAVFAFEIESEALFEAENETARLRIISSTDEAVFAPIIAQFQSLNPSISVYYVVASSAEISKAISQENEAFDIAISSAMDLQTKLANDGFALQHISAATALVPAWGNWRNSVFTFSQEPATFVLSNAAFEGLEMPRTRQDLISLLRAQPDRFDGKIGTYDVRTSGLGYLFATQDSRTSETFWRLTELMGSLGAKLYCCSSQMIEDVSTGKIAIAYNVLGSYAAARTDLADAVTIVAPQDYTAMMLRTAVILKTATAPDVAGLFVDHLLRGAWGAPPAKEVAEYTRPIPLGPGLLVFLDRLKRRQFLAEWTNAIEQ